ncbi:hypothetical protein BU17DRAFT_78653 [Hysterangium stoloniferum]|nr:hypothetical protein BU17DRAFT_78653 [Hysterangium stoloniferum]
MHALVVLLVFAVTSALSAPLHTSDNELLVNAHRLHGPNKSGSSNTTNNPKLAAKSGHVCLDNALLKITPMLNGFCTGNSKSVPLHIVSVVRLPPSLLPSISPRKTRTRTTVELETRLVSSPVAAEHTRKSILFSPSSILPQAVGPVVIHFSTRLHPPRPFHISGAVINTRHLTPTPRIVVTSGITPFSTPPPPAMITVTVTAAARTRTTTTTITPSFISTPTAISAIVAAITTSTSISLPATAATSTTTSVNMESTPTTKVPTSTVPTTSSATPTTSDKRTLIASQETAVVTSTASSTTYSTSISSTTATTAPTQAFAILANSSIPVSITRAVTSAGMSISTILTTTTMTATSLAVFTSKPSGTTTAFISTEVGSTVTNRTTSIITEPTTPIAPLMITETVIETVTAIIGASTTAPAVRATITETVVEIATAIIDGSTTATAVVMRTDVTTSPKSKPTDAGVPRRAPS